MIDLDPGIGKWVLPMAGIILLAEIIAGRHRAIYSKSDWLVNGVCIFVGALIRPLGAIAIAYGVSWVMPVGRNALAGTPFIPAVIGIILIGEFFNYWVHRWSHFRKDSRWFDWLWRMHRTHHTAKYVNVVLNYRVSIFWSLVSGLTWTLAFAIFLGLGKEATFAIALFSFWAVVTHSDFRWDDAVRSHRIFGPAFRALEHVIVSPGLHHSHHGYGKDGGNYRNFGILLSIYDWMFGTLHIPQGRPFRYGIPGKMPHWLDDAFSPINLRHVFAKNKGEEESPAGTA